MVRRIAMWSPPRARSTLMMRVFESLGCAVFDEPFYAYWLKATHKTDDPGYEHTLAAHETNWRKVVEQIQAQQPTVQGSDWVYQKHMAIHMLAEVDLGWMNDASFVHCFLIRDPREVIASMMQFRDLRQVHDSQGAAAAAALVGIPQLLRIYDRACELAGEESLPPVIDANDVLRDPGSTLESFCSRVGMPFDVAAPLHWPAGQHAADGAWAPFWYKKVFKTQSLQPYKPQKVELPAELQPVVDACMPTYEKLYARRVSR